MEKTELPQTTNSTSDENPEISNTFALLEEGKENICLNEEYKNITIVIGNTGAGKSTFIQWIAGDNSKLVSKEVVKNSGKFLIEDGNRIGSSTITSKTLFPELVIHNKTNAAYYDCPGFSDTRSTSHDIASTYFIRQVVDHATSVKIVIVVSYNTAQQGGSRSAFVDLLEHITNLIRSIDKFRNSIGLIVTKVNNLYVPDDEDNLVLVPDETVILTIAEFLQEVKQDLGTSLNHYSKTPQKQIFYKEAINLLNILMIKKKEKNYERIGIFRMPNKKGMLSKIPLLRKGKNRIEKMLYEKLQYSRKNDNDFGYTISDKSKNDINRLVEKINQNVWLEISKVVGKIKTNFENLIGEMLGKIDSFGDSNSEIVDVDEKEAQTFTTKLYKGLNLISGLVKDSNNTKTMEGLAEITANSITRLEIQTCTENIKNIKEQSKFFHFLQAVSKRQLNIRPETWSILFQKIESYIIDSKKVIEKLVQDAGKKINDKVSFEISEVVEKIQNYYTNITEQMRGRITSFVDNNQIVDAGEKEAQAFTTRLNIASSVISSLLARSLNMTTIEALATITANGVTRLEMNTCAKNIKNINDLGRFLKFLQGLSDRQLNISPESWFSAFHKMEIHFFDSEKVFQEHVQDAAENINQKVWIEISEIVEKLQNHYRILIVKINDKINGFVDNTKTIDATEAVAQDLTKRLNLGTTVMSNLIIQTKNVRKVEDIANIISNIITSLGIDNCAKSINDITNQGRFFTFLQALSKRQLKTRSWSELFNKTDSFLFDSKRNIEKNIQERAKNIYTSIDLFVKNVMGEIEEHYQIKMEIHEIDKLPTELNKGVQILSQLVKETRNLNNAQDLSEKVSHAVMKLDTSGCSSIDMNTLKILHRGKYLDFLKILNDGVLSTWSSDWMIHVKNTSEHLSESEAWYIFLNHLYNKFSEYEIQKDKNNYNVANIDHWGLKNKSRGIVIDKDNFKTFLDKIKGYGIKEWASVENLGKVTELQLTELNRVLGLTLRNGIYSQCPEPGKLVIRGDFIKFSDFITNDGKMESCQLTVCQDKVTSVVIFALNTAFIDRDFTGVGSKLKVTLVAPKWHVEGNRKINLNGTDGFGLSKAKEGDYPSGEGNDGKPGLQGGSAGNFLGIANEIANGESLTITTVGGRGGPGQDGGDGGEGSPGQDAQRNDNFSRILLREDKTVPTKIVEHYKYFGEGGYDGGHGGDGGIGGFGGPKGSIKIFQLENQEIFGRSNLISSQGSQGAPGKGGSGGKGGKDGNDKIWYYCQDWVLFIPAHHWCSGRENPEKVIERYTTGYQGSNGRDGYNSIGREATEKEIPFQNVANILNEYKMYLLENLSDHFKKHSLMGFVTQLHGSAEIRSSYNTLALVNELKELEKQLYDLHGLKRGKRSIGFSKFKKIPNISVNKDSHIYFYQSILNRTSELARNSENLQQKKVLNHLYLATLSRIYNLRDDFYPNLIIDIEQNLDLVKLDLDDLKKIEKATELSRKLLQQKNEKATSVNQYREKFKSAIDVKLSEAKYFIDSQFMTEIHNINAQIENKIALLINETVMLQEQAEEKLEELVQKKRELKKSFVVSSTLKGFKILGGIISLFGAVGSAIGSAIKLGTEIGETATASNGEALFDIQTIKSGLWHLKDQKAFYFNFNGTSSDFYNQYKADGKTIKSIDDAIDQAKISIEKLDRYESDMHEILIPQLENMVNDLESAARQLDNKSKIFLEVSKWQVQKGLRYMKLMIRQFTKGFMVEDNLARCIENFEEVIITLISVYDCIQDYEYQKQLADYLAEINSPNDSNIDITDAQLRNATNDLDVLTKSNLALKRYKIAVDALLQHTFPLGHLYLAQSELPSHLKLEDNIQNLVDKVTEEVRNIETKIKKYKTSITQHDTYMNSGWFTSDFESTKPFFTWKNKKYKDTISNLLSGKKVVLRSDIFNSPAGKDAIKFNMIGINFSSSNLSISSEILNKLKKFRASMTHLGNSYYRFSNKIFTIKSASQNIRYSFEKDNLGNPVNKNKVYDKIKSGDITLSPYAMWEIQLINPYNEIPFSELEMYKDKVDVELIGYGGYLAKGYNISNLEVDLYYKDNEVMSELSYFNELDYRMIKDGTEVQKSLLVSKDGLSEKSGHNQRNKRLVFDTNQSDAARSKGNRLQFWPINCLRKIGTTISTYLSSQTTNANSKEGAPPPHSLLFSEQTTKTYPEPPTGSVVLEMGDQWLKNTDITNLLTWGVYFVRKWTGYRPEETMLPNDGRENQVDLEIVSATLAEEFMQIILEQAATCGIRPNVRHIFQDNKLNYKAKKIILQKLSAGELGTVPQLLYNQLILPYIDKISLNTTRAQANRFAYNIKNRIINISERFLEQEQKWFTERQRLEKSAVSLNVTNAKKEMNHAIPNKTFSEYLTQHPLNICSAEINRFKNEKISILKPC